MQLRLAFAVAAHLEPEILLIDEVLAVGDAEFQKKCIGKMEEVSKLNGRTILFVSHQLDSLAKLCTKGIWIENGQLNHNGDIQNTIELYTKAINDISPNTIFERKEINDNHLFKYALLLTPVIQIGDDIKLKVHLSDKYKGRRLVININLYNSHGDLISHIINEDDDFSTENLSTNIISVNLKNVAVPPGKYFLSFWAGFDMLHGIDEMNKAISFTISDQQHFTKRIAPFPTNSKIILKSEWLAD